MKISFLLLFLLCNLLFFSCSPPEVNKVVAVIEEQQEQQEQKQEGMTIASRFQPPQDYHREKVAQSSFAHYLRHLPLYPSARKVKLYNGEWKGNQRAQAAVVNMDVGQRDLQQCADAVMRLRAEYLWQQKAYADIQFNFTSGFPANYSRWRAGNRINVNGNQVNWTAGTTVDTTYASFRKYMLQVFSYAGTHSLEKELKKVNAEALAIGDVFIQGGFPGHAIIVVDKVINVQGDFAFLLAQSYMPAQDIHVLKNPSRKAAWYYASELKGQLRTPEWTFSGEDLRRF